MAKTKSVESQLADMSTNNTALMMAYNANEAEKARTFSEYMSNTSHQREVADLKAAGLNPVLSSNAGANAYTANSATAGVDSAVNALSNMEIARRTNAVNLKLGKLNYQSALASAAATRAAAAASAAGMMGAASISGAASRYVADQNLAGAKYTADHTKSGGIISGIGKMKEKGIGGVLNDWAEFWSH